MLAAILDVAVKDRRIPSNPARGVTLPRKTKGQHAYLSHRQVALLAQNSRKHATLVLALAYTGLLWGEATALRIRDVDMVRRRIQVHENAVSVSGTIHVGTPKTHQARAVPYPTFLNPLFVELMKNSTGALVVAASYSSTVASITSAAPIPGAVGLCRRCANRRLPTARFRE